MSNSIAPGSSADVNVRVTALTTNPNVPVTYKTIILKKNLVNGVNTLTQEMMSVQNTKYVIKYDYTLAENITVPANCILEFDGGSLSNGTLQGDAFDIVSPEKKIFDGIKFSGSASRVEVHIEWFVSQYYDTYTASTDKDATEQLEEVFNCGANKIIIATERYYYVSRTISISGHVDIYKRNNQLYQDKASNGYSGFIYSNAVSTIIDYQYNDANSETLEIDGLSIYCTKPFDTTTVVAENERPIIYIHNTTNLWGVTLNLTIKSKEFQINPNTLGWSSYNDLIYYNSRIGLKLTAENGYISYVKIKGSYQNLNKGIVTTKLNNNWFTQLIIDADTQCNQGGILEGGQPVQIYGAHQTQPAFSSTKYSIGYFVAPIAKMYGYVWDRGQRYTPSLLYSTAYSIQETQAYATNPYTSLKRNYPYISCIENSFNSVSYGPNALNNRNGLISDFAFQVSDDEVNWQNALSPNNTLVNVFNQGHLFLDGIIFNKTSFSDIRRMPSGMYLNKPEHPGKLYYKLSFKLERVIWNCSKMLYIATLGAERNFTVKVNSEDSITIPNALTETYKYIYSREFDDKDATITITWDVTNDASSIGYNNFLYMPCVYIPSLFNGNAVFSELTKAQLKLTGNTSGIYFGGNNLVKLTDVGRIGYIDSTGNIVSVDGERLFIKKGSTLQRPILSNIDNGYQFFDSQIGKPIWWLVNTTYPNGTWVDATGATV